MEQGQLPNKENAKPGSVTYRCWLENGTHVDVKTENIQGLMSTCYQIVRVDVL